MRAGVVTGMPWRVVTSSGEGARAVDPQARPLRAAAARSGRSRRPIARRSAGCPRAHAADRVAERRAGPHGEDGGHPAPASGERRCGRPRTRRGGRGGVGPARVVDGDRARPSEPERAELRAATDAVLAARRSARSARSTRGRDDFAAHIAVHSPRERRAPEHAGSRRACGARIATIRARLRYAAVASMLRRT